MNWVLSFTRLFSPWEGVSMAASCFAIGVSVVALIYSRRGTIAAEKMASASILAAEAAQAQAAAAHMTHLHSERQSQLNLLRSREAYRSAIIPISKNLSRIEHLLAMSQRDEQISGLILSPRAWRELKILAEEVGSSAQLAELDATIRQTGLCTEHRRFRLETREADVLGLAKVRSTLEELARNLEHMG